jgi:hypothetical protein
VKTVPYTSIRDGILRRMGIDAAQPLIPSQAEALIEYTTAALDEAWLFYDWPEIYLTEERTPDGSSWVVAGFAYLADTVGTIFYLGRAPAGSETTDLLWRVKKITTTLDGGVLSVETANGIAWDDRFSATYALDTDNSSGEIPYILLDQDELTPIGTVIKIYDKEPGPNSVARTLRYLTGEDRIYITDPAYTGGNVWVRFSLPIPRLTTAEYSPSATYALGDLVFLPTTGDCSSARQPTTGNLPTDPENWRRQRIPHFLAEFLKLRAHAETLFEDGQSDKGSLSLARAEKILLDKMDQAWLRRGEVQHYSATFQFT